LVLLTVPLLSACGASWSEEYKQGAAALKKGQFDAAESHLQAAAEAATRAGNQQGEAISILGLARAHMEQGEYGQAHPLFEKIVKMLEQARGHNSAAVADAMIELGACLYQEQEFTLAEPVCKEALAIEMRLPKEKQRTATIGMAYNNLAQIARSRDDDAAAEQYFQKAIALYRKDTSNAGKGSLVQTYCNLASLYNHQERYEEARLLVAQAMDIQKTIIPSDDLSLAAVLNTVASIDRAELNNEAAAEEYDEAIAVLQKRLKDGSAFEKALCDTKDNLADLQAEERDLDLAEKTYLESIQHCIHARGKDHPCVAERMVDLAELYSDTDRYPMAEKLLKRALAIYSASYDTESPIVINTINDLSQVYVEQNKYTEANALYEEWLPRLRHELGDNHPHIADALDNWAMVAEKSNDAQQARELRARAKGIRLALTKQP
jgi:tetratricopeptide (TPR) repeat protein